MPPPLGAPRCAHSFSAAQRCWPTSPRFRHVRPPAGETLFSRPAIEGFLRLFLSPFQLRLRVTGKPLVPGRNMKPSLIQKIVNATLLLAPIAGAFLAAAAVRAAEPGPTVTLLAVDAHA